MKFTLILVDSDTRVIRMRVPNCEERENGTIWSQSGFPIIISSASKFTREQLEDFSKKRDWSEIEAEAFVRLGENACEFMAFDGDAALDSWRAEQICKRQFDIGNNGEMVIVHDVRDAIEIGSAVRWDGVLFDVVNEGEIFKAGEYQKRRAYLAKPRAYNATHEEVSKWRDYLQGLKVAHSERFDRMMADEQNDGARLPRDYSSLVESIIELISSPLESLHYQLKQIEGRKSCGGVCWIVGQRATEVLARIEAGETDVEKLKAEYEAVTESHEYKEASWI